MEVMPVLDAPDDAHDAANTAATAKEPARSVVLVRGAPVRRKYDTDVIYWA